MTEDREKEEKDLLQQEVAEEQDQLSVREPKVPVDRVIQTILLRKGEILEGLFLDPRESIVDLLLLELGIITQHNKMQLL